MIYKLQRNRVRRSYYGGKNIDAFYNNSDCKVSRYPEEWIASTTLAFNPDLPVKNEGLSKIESGAYLVDIINKAPKKILGELSSRHDNNKMSFLLKLLDAAERLVIQVHPDTAFAQENFHSQFGKTECWYMLNDSEVFLGFKPGVTKERWIRLFYENNTAQMLDCMHKLKVKKGELVFVAGGVPHAIGQNSFLLELQEPTDLMIIPERITPSGLKLPDEKLHGGIGFEKMFDCFHYDGMTEETIRQTFLIAPRKINDALTVIVDRKVTDKFSMIKIDVAERYTIQNDNMYRVMFVTAGHGSIIADGEETKITKGSQLFITADTHTLTCIGELSSLMCYPSIGSE